ncbi:hypothetical protein PHLGIDRAFT_103209 [Phlebiopsis gigantea 11061_1 CR5-6]|uniref:Uncharacterized protein n=1 Tax=Phlebiopsis gigantea (strain 11061_1 CR5-6) TaxID=745531 RepID=A0A0C3S1Y7_PHLG1|nr:hypothetical protein PHLGIDRAFT_103209 [Phlebiopsis gigantea 11061_1 CR5-6]
MPVVDGRDVPLTSPFKGTDDLFRLPKLDRATAAGISVAIAGNILISLALNCQKLAHRRLELEREHARELLDQKPDDRRPLHGPDALGITEEEDINETTNDDQRWSSEVPYPDGTASATPGAVLLETEPLLDRNGRPASAYDTSGLPHISSKPSLAWYARLSPWRKRARRIAREADFAHLQSAHSLVPVDIVRARPKSPRRESSESSVISNGTESDYLKSKLWWVGFTLMNVGETGNFISYGFAPASVVAPLGTFALIANCAFAPLMLKERFRKRDILGILIAIVGAITVVLSANSSDTKLDPNALIQAITQHTFIVYTAIYIVTGIILSGLSERSIGQRYVFVDVGLCAIFGGFTVLSTKAFSSLLTREWFEIFTEWITYPILITLIGTGVGQIKYLNRALMRFDSKIVVPTQFVTFNLSAIIGSAILYGDFKRASFHQIVTFLYGCAATFAGVFIIAWSRDTPGPADLQDEGVGPQDDIEAVAVNVDDDATVRNLQLGSLGRRSRATLVIPESATISPLSTPILRHRPSIVSMIGLSPAQRALIVHSPPRDTLMRTLSQERESDTLYDDEGHRRRAISLVGEGSPAQRGSQRRRVLSNAGSREQSHSRTRTALTRSPTSTASTK